MSFKNYERCTLTHAYYQERIHEGIKDKRIVWFDNYNFKYMFKNLLKWYTPHFERFVQNVIAMRFAIIHEHKYIKTRYVPYIKIAFVSISFDADAVKLSLILFLHHLHKLPTPFHTRRWTCVYVLNGQCRTYHINAKFSKKVDRCSAASLAAARRWI